MTTARLALMTCPSRILSHAMSLCREYAWPFLLYTLHIGGHEDTVTRVTTRHPGQLVFYKLHSDIVTCVSEKQAHSSL